VTPDDPLVRHYLDQSMVMRLATISARGNASITPLWFVVEHGRVLASTSAATLAARNAEADARVTVLLDAEKAGHSEIVVRLSGTAEVHHGLPSAQVMARFAAKYYLAPGGLRSEIGHARQRPLRTRYYAQSDAVLLAIEPTEAELVPLPSPAAPEEPYRTDQQ